jgi:beta-lactamase regulating signal transducer with metallopeptidase domain
MNDAMQLLVPVLATALLQFLWQGAVVGLLAWLALALLRNARPQARYAVACMALLACVLLPAWTLLEALGADAPGMGSVAPVADAFFARTSAASGTAFRVLAAPSTAALPWVVALWASGVALLSLRMGCGLLWVRGLCRAAETERTGHWQACVDRLAPRLGIARPVTLRLAREGHSPVTAGWWRPVVLLPLAVATRMPADLVEALIAHELAHVRRHDYLVNLLQGAAEALLFYHPVVWWLSHRIRVERELVADDLAATVLDDRRRLAMALSELDRLALSHQIPPRTLAPLPHYAPAAHGGHLMSRIKQLVRPERRALGSAIALPLIGLAMASATFYAHARLSTSTLPVTPFAAAPAQAASPQAMSQVASVQAAQPSPAPTARPAAQVVVAAESRPDRSTFALVRAGRDDISMAGSGEDIDDIRATRDQIQGDFVWFRRDGKAWVVRDQKTVARVQEAWAGTEALSTQMQALEAKMRPHSARMEALGKQMEALSVDRAVDTPDTRAAYEKMRTLGEKMGKLGERQADFARRMERATAADMAKLESEQATLQREQEAVSQEMERHNETLSALSARMEAQQKPMEALGREMEAAGKPMEAIGREMEAHGKKIELEAERAAAQVRSLLDEAYRGGLAQPAPSRQ